MKEQSTPLFPAPLNPDPLYDTKAAADYMDVKPQTVYNWRHLRKGPDYVLIGGRLPRYRKSALDRYIAQNTVVLNE
jgi:hypothetical protein